jgi:glutamyl-tRNA synthetase
MPATLTISPKESPFPWAAVAIAANTEAAVLAFSEDATGPLLQLDGTTITDEEEIVKALAKKGGLSEDSTKVGRVSY